MLIPKSWRTTVAGMLGAAVNIALPLVQSGTIDERTLILSASLAALGWVAKDAGVSGLEK